jgi:O-antigen/teichoic acid export membrane protein
MRAALPIILNQAVTLALGLVSLKLINRLVPPDVYGAYVLFLTLTQVGTLLTHSGLSNHATRYWQRENQRAGAYVRFLAAASARVLLPLTLLLLAITIGLAAARQELIWVWIFPLLLVSNAALALNLVGTGALNADQSFWKVFWLTQLGNAGRTFLPILFALATQMNFVALSAGFTLHGVLILAGLAAWFIAASKTPKPEAESEQQWIRELKDYGRPYALLGAGAWLLQFADRWVVEGFYGEEPAGQFALAASLGTIIPTMVMPALMQWVFPCIFRRADSAKSPSDWIELAKSCDRMTAAFLFISIAGLLALWAASPWLVGWLISEKYVPALTMLVPAGFAALTSQVNQFYYLLLQGQHDSASMVKVMLVVSGVKTLGSIVAAAMSLPVLMSWLILSVAVGGCLGRWLIRRVALTRTQVSRL